jgi:CO dehydrogenase/acetyl-CoA synthase gamma subunit (corrinoid Fe-S protein)
VSSADLYVEKIDFLRYLNTSDCRECGFPSCNEFLYVLKAGKTNVRACPFLSRNRAYAFEAIGKIQELWPEVPLLTHPRPGFTGLIELNSPDPSSLVLVTGNNEHTEEVIMTVLGTTVCPFFVICVDTRGDTVDMAMIYQSLTAEKIYHALNETGIKNRVQSGELLIPGLAAPLKDDIERLSGWKARVGPVCAAELPLFLSEIWIPPDEQ